MVIQLPRLSPGRGLVQTWLQSVDYERPASLMAQLGPQHRTVILKEVTT